MLRVGGRLLEEGTDGQHRLENRLIHTASQYSRDPIVTGTHGGCFCPRSSHPVSQRCPHNEGVAVCLWLYPIFGDRTGPVSEQALPSASHMLGGTLHPLTSSSILGSRHHCGQVTDQKTEAPTCLAMLGLELPHK